MTQIFVAHNKTVMREFEIFFMLYGRGKIDKKLAKNSVVLYSKTYSKLDI